MVRPCRGLGLTHLGQALQPGSSKTALGVGGLFSVSPRPDRSSLCSHSKAAQAARTSDLFTFMHWRRKWQPTPVFLPGESQGRGSLVGCRLWVTESDTTEAT